MVQNPAISTEDDNKRSHRDLLIWMALIPLILLTLLCCGQMAMYTIPSAQGDNTGSHLSADYRPWPYDQIPPVNVQAFLKDVSEEQALNGTLQPEETIIVGNYWELSTSTAIAVSQGTETVEPGRTRTPTTSLPLTGTPTRTIVATQTSTALSTSTRIPTSTLLPTITPTTFISHTPTKTWPPPPPPTNTPVPPPKATRTPTSTQAPQPETLTPTPTGTFTDTPTPIDTLTPTFTSTTTLTNTPTFTSTPTVLTPTYAPLRPIAENNGTADQVNGGCRAYFGYRNDNPNEIDIPVGPLNFLDDPAAAANPPQPTHFLVGRVFGAFEFTWYSGLPLTWTLDSRTATADWCYP